MTGSTSNVLYGNGVFGSITTSYGNSNVATFLASYGSNTITTTGDISVGNIGANSASFTGTLSATGNSSVGGFLVQGSVGTGISANGTTQGTARVLTNQINLISTSTAGANAVQLPSPSAGTIVYITNAGSTSIRVFPTTGGQINGVGINLQYIQAVTTTQQYIAISTTQWYTYGTN